MKIVNYEEFVRMPAGTIFAPFEPCVFTEEFAVKTDAGEERDIPYTALCPGGRMWTFNGVMPLRPWLGEFDGFLGAQEDAEYAIYDGCHNDYDKKSMFAILEEQDVKKLIKVLEWALKGCEGEVDE